MAIPFIDLSGQYQSIEKELFSAIKGVIHSRHFVLGENVEKLEKKFAEKIGAKFAISLASGTDALYLSLLALGIGRGDEVITTPFTFFATAGTISHAGATPVFADVDPSTFNLDPQKIESKITKRTKAIMPVHLYGLPCDMKAIMSIAKRHKLPIIEDAAQAFGAQHNGRMAGSIGSVGCFSFYPTKNLSGAGDGGIAVTSSAEIAEKIRLLRNYGSRKKYHHELIGTNSRLDEIQAAIILVKLKYIDRWNALRNKHAASYTKTLQNLPLQTPKIPAHTKHVFHLYSIATEKRDALAAHLTKAGIGSGTYYPLPLHLQPCYKNLGYKLGDFPVSERLASQALSLPMYAELSSRQVNAVISSVKDFFCNNP